MTDPDTIIDSEASGEFQPIEPPRDAREANQLLRRLARVMANYQRDDELFAADIAEMEARRTLMMGPYVREIERIKATLNAWHLAVLADEPDRKTIKLPAGTLTAKIAIDEIDVSEAEFIAWATQNAPELIVAKPTVPKKPLREWIAGIRKDNLPIVDPTSFDERLTSGGEIVPGLVMRRGGTNRSGEHLNIAPAAPLASDEVETARLAA